MRVLHTESKVVILTFLPFSINELCIIERRIASLRAWRTVRSVCVNLPVRRFRRYVPGSDNDTADLLHSGQPVCNDEGGTPLHGCVQAFLHQDFGFRIQCAGGFVQQQKWRIFSKLPARWQCAGVARRTSGCRVLPGMSDSHPAGGDEFFHLRRFGGGHHFIIAGSGASVPDILQGIGREDHRILRHDGNLVTQFMQRKLANILPVETDGAIRHIIKTQ